MKEIPKWRGLAGFRGQFLTSPLKTGLWGRFGFSGQERWYRTTGYLNAYIHYIHSRQQGRKMAYFQNKNPNLGEFRRVLEWKMLVYCITIWSFCGHLVYILSYSEYFMVIWYIFPVLVCCTKKNLAILVDRYFDFLANVSSTDMYTNTSWLFWC
jgi:hypothetical protein